MQIPILSGIIADKSVDFRTAYPINMMIHPCETGISKGYLKPASGAVLDGTGPGIDRGGINWGDICYRVMGNKLVSIAGGVATTLGEVGDDGKPVTLDYGFDRLAIASAGRLFYCTLPGSVLTQVTDTNLGTVLDVVWSDGYYITTDGTSIIVTELNDPMAVDPLKYGSSEVDPDPIVALKRLRDEVYAIGRYTIEVFDNVGGDGFPFQRSPGAMVPKGAVGTHAVCVFNGTFIAFVGGGRNEGASVYLSLNGAPISISTREVDKALAELTALELAAVTLDTKVCTAQKLLFVHLPTKTLVYDAEASSIAQEPVWTVLTSSLTFSGAYRIRNLVLVGGTWMCGDPLTSQFGHLDDDLASHYGVDVPWRFTTGIMYNVGKMAQIHAMELVCLTGSGTAGVTPTISTQYSTDGETWSQDRPISVGNVGERAKRMVWFSQGTIRNWRIQRFTGTSQAYLVVARLDANIEPLSY